MKTLLLVDDNETSLKLLKAVFNEDYKLFIAFDGLEALEILFQHQVDLVVTDVLMPNMDGYQLSYKIRTNQRLKDIPIIIYTATYVSQSEEATAREMGASVYLRKPAPPKVLAGIVMEILNEPDKFPHIIPKRIEATERLSQYNVKLISKLEQNNVELEEANAKLKISESKFRNTLENMLEGVQIINRDWRYVYVNDALTRYSYHNKETLLKHSILELYPGVEKTELFAKLKQCMEERTSHHIENDFTFPDGITRNFELSIQPVPEGIFILSIDITDRKMAEEKMLKANRLYGFISAINQSIVHIKDAQQLLDTACNIAIEVGKYKMAWIGLLDNHGKMNFVSVKGEPAAVEVWNSYSGIDYSTDKLKNTVSGRTLRTGEYTLSNDVRNDANMLVWKELLERFNINANIALPIKKFGSTIGVFGLVSTEVNHFDDAEIALLVEAAGDISFALEVFEKEEQRALAEKEIEKLNQSLEQKVKDRTWQLQEINNDLESFNSSVSHDLRSPLQVISGYSSILSQKYNATLDEEAQELLRGIKGYTRQMSRIMESLLNLSQLGRASVERTPVNMKEIVKAVIAELKLVDKSIKVEITLGDIADAECDPALIRQVWMNLISNAIKYSAQSGKPRVEISSFSKGDELIYVVKDNGAGFDSKNADKLFKPFQRLHGAAEFEGVGIGLTIAHRIVTKHSGKIWAEAVEGEGATFCFTLNSVRKRTQATT